MSFFNHNAKEIHCKIVYYGPSLSGKTTNIQWIYNNTATDQKSKLITLDTELERTIFFDFLPLNVGEIRGYKVRFHLYSVPGQVVYDSSRKLILKGLDGIVFVADSQAERMEENLEAWRNLETNIKQQGLTLQDLPLVIQYNKRDLPNAAPLPKLREALNRIGAIDFEAVASEGRGVMESLKHVSKSIIRLLQEGP
ncbi:MAG: ADP-ribosylation factor-like protein [Bdellovibrionaceae bacterium]|jgi:signal recognition particle receptor subunit beta|nr:ADP-ribosylation factor-like protein [Pseudobdellovibrionaceae bacterium]